MASPPRRDPNERTERGGRSRLSFVREQLLNVMTASQTRAMVLSTVRGSPSSRRLCIRDLLIALASGLVVLVTAEAWKWVPRHQAMR